MFHTESEWSRPLNAEILEAESSCKMISLQAVNKLHRTISAVHKIMSVYALYCNSHGRSQGQVARAMPIILMRRNTLVRLSLDGYFATLDLIPIVSGSPHWFRLSLCIEWSQFILSRCSNFGLKCVCQPRSESNQSRMGTYGAHQTL